MTTAPSTTHTTPINAVTPSPRLPRVRGLNPTLLRLEVLRTIREPSSLVFALAMPVSMFFMFGNAAGYADEPVGNGNVAAWVMIGMALYGALIAATGAGASVSAERAMGWSRQLRLTPLSSVAYIVTKAIAGLSLSLLSVGAVYLCGVLGRSQMPVRVWIASFLITWLGSLMFAAFGLFMGYVLPAKNAMRIVGPSMALLAFLGNVFVPIKPDSLLDQIARWSPMYGLHDLAVWPLAAPAHPVIAILNVTLWTSLFTFGAAWLMRRDTDRA